MPHEEIDGVPIWYEEHGDPDGPPLVALHGGILTFNGSFGDVLPWLAQGRPLMRVELPGHGHTPDTGRPMSIERFADDVAELVDRVASSGPADLWGFSLGALTAKRRRRTGPLDGPASRARRRRRPARWLPPGDRGTGAGRSSPAQRAGVRGLASRL